MKVKPGYKLTEVGVIPEDWEVKPLGELATLYQPITISAKQFTKDGFPVYGANGVVGFYNKWNHNTWQVTVTCRGSTCGTVNRTVDRCWITGNAMVLNCDHNNLLSKDFFYYLLSSQNLSGCITGTGQPQIVRSPLAAFCVALSLTKAEQQAIAEALSDADALIESLEQLVAKKLQLKQGAMQELLTGRKRLPGFEVRRGYKKTEAGMIPEDWDFSELSKILKSMQLGGNYKNSERETNWPLIKMGNLGRGNIKLDRLEFINSTQRPSMRDRLEFDDVLLNTRNTLDLVGKVAIWRNELPEAYFNSNIMRLKFDEQCVSSYRFMNYILNTARSLRELRGFAIGTTSVAAIYSRDLVKLKIPLPIKAEQEAIAEVLSDMDAEIAALEAKLAKARQIKQGMMQELLTGRIRLV